MDNQQLWQAVLGELELQLSKANFTTWFRGTFVCSYEEKKVIIGVPNAFTKSWLEKKYNDQILEALRNISEDDIKEVFYKVETGKSAPKTSADSTVVLPRTQSIGEENSSANSFGLNNRYTFEKFIVGKTSELAYAACEAVSQTPGKVYNPLFIYGGVGLGKTHLLQAIGHQIGKSGGKIMYVTSEKFTNEYIQSVKNGKAKEFKDAYRNVDLLLIDDIQFIAGKEGTQEEFFHTFNHLHQSNKQIVLTSDRPPKAIPALEKRLLSRFEWGMIADISTPDLETRIAILEAKVKEKGYNIDNEVISFIASHVKNNVRELEGALNRIIAFHELNNTDIDLENVKNILNTITSSSSAKKSATPKEIIKTVAEFYDIGTDDITGKSREKRLAFPRQIIMYLMREEIKCSYPSIGHELGGRDHTTAMHAYQKITKEIENNERIRQEINSIKERLFN